MVHLCGKLFRLLSSVCNLYQIWKGIYQLLNYSFFPHVLLWQLLNHPTYVNLTMRTVLYFYQHNNVFMYSGADTTASFVTIRGPICGCFFISAMRYRINVNYLVYSATRTHVSYLIEKLYSVNNGHYWICITKKMCSTQFYFTQGI